MEKAKITRRDRTSSSVAGLEPPSLCANGTTKGFARGTQLFCRGLFSKVRSLGFEGFSWLSFGKGLLACSIERWAAKGFARGTQLLRRGLFSKVRSLGFEGFSLLSFGKGLLACSIERWAAKGFATDRQLFCRGLFSKVRSLGFEGFSLLSFGKILVACSIERCAAKGFATDRQLFCRGLFSKVCSLGFEVFSWLSFGKILVACSIERCTAKGFARGTQLFRRGLFFSQLCFGFMVLRRGSFRLGFVSLLGLFLAFSGSLSLHNSYASPVSPYPSPRLAHGWSGLLGLVLHVAETMGQVRPPATSMIIISAPTPKDEFTRAFIDALRIRGFAVWEQEKSLLGRKKLQIPSGITAFRLKWTLEGIKGSSFIRLTLKYEDEALTRVFFRSKEGKLKDTGPWTRRMGVR